MEYRATTTIEASPATIWALLTDGAGYPSWNTTVERVQGRIALGESVKVFTKLMPKRAFPVKVAKLTREKEMVWQGGMPLGLFKGVRTFTLSHKGSSTEFTMHEVFSGLLKPMMAKAMPDLQPAFDEFAACVKRQAEGK